MKYLVKIVFFLVCLLLLFYLALPNPEFPAPPPDSLQSKEPADTETPLRRAYFTNFTREEVLNHYKNQLTRSTFLNITLPTYRLNYPPEEAQTIIRDQTRSTFLEEIVHPFRESIYVNGFKPKEEKDAILIAGRNWRQKIIVRYVPSNSFFRLFVALLSLSLIWILISFWSNILRDLYKIRRKLTWIFR
jgi:hypothetical protein